MISTKDGLLADTINYFCSSDKCGYFFSKGIRKLKMPVREPPFFCILKTVKLGSILHIFMKLSC
jgi:hypothetical protein